MSTGSGPASRARVVTADNRAYTGTFRGADRWRPQEPLATRAIAWRPPQATHRAARGIQHLLQRLHIRRTAGHLASQRHLRTATRSLPASIMRCAWPPVSQMRHQVDRQQFCRRPVLQGRLRADLEFRHRTESQQSLGLELSYMAPKARGSTSSARPTRASRFAPHRRGRRLIGNASLHL